MGAHLEMLEVEAALRPLRGEEEPELEVVVEEEKSQNEADENEEEEEMAPRGFRADLRAFGPPFLTTFLALRGMGTRGWQPRGFGPEGLQNPIPSFGRRPGTPVLVPRVPDLRGAGDESRARSASLRALPASDGPRQLHAASLMAEGRCAREVSRRSLLPLLVVPAWTLVDSPPPSAAGNEFTFFREFESILSQCAPMIAEVRRAGGRMLYR